MKSLKALRDIAKNSDASQEEYEMYQILRDLNDINPKVIVEIGVHKGGSVQAWLDAFNPRILVGIEINEDQQLIDRFKDTKVELLFKNSTDLNTVTDLKQILKGQPIDFLFIDGDHHFATVKREFEIYSPLVRKGGAIGFHDTNAYRKIDGVSVYAFMAELDTKLSFKTADYKAYTKSPGTRLIWL